MVIKKTSTHPDIAYGKNGILLINLGTPDSTSVNDVRRYLKEFLSDKRIIEINKVLWWFILNFIILRIRPSKTAKVYQEIWMKDINKSPLRHFTELQKDGVDKRIGNKKNIVEYAMRYGEPSIASKIKYLKNIGCENIIVLPLYPQYSSATTGSVCDAVFRALLNMRWQPSVQIVPHYESNPLYISALLKILKGTLSNLKWKPDIIITSYHGIPKRYFLKGDPYHCHCHKTTRLLQESYRGKVPFMTTFQSRFGPEEWLTPYTEEKLIELANKGFKNIVIMCPGFAADCIETLEEINLRAKEVFIENGGKNFFMVPCLNANKNHIDLMESLIKKFL